MQNEIFYFYSQNGRNKDNQINADKNHWIAAKFLIVNGTPVVDPNRAAQVNLYQKLNASGKIDESSIFSNPHNYLIVPANYDPKDAAYFAAGVDIGMAGTAATVGPETEGFGGLAAAEGVGLAAMTSAFLPRHEQDLQRGERWGIPKGETAPAFRDAAPWNLGFVTQLTGLPNEAAVVGGGALNTGEYVKGFVKEYLFGGPAPIQKLDGPMGMSGTDYKAFLQGLKDARAAGYSGSLGEFARELRNNIRARGKSGAKTLLDLALSLGGHGLGSFAPGNA